MLDGSHSHWFIAPICAALLIAWFLLPGNAHAQEEPAFDHGLFTGPIRDVRAQRFDQQHLRLALRVNPAEERIQGDALLSVRRFELPADSLLLHAAGLEIDSILVGTTDSTLHRTSYRESGDSLFIRLAPLTSDSTELPSHFLVRTYYVATPSRGLYFMPPSDRGGSVEIWSQGEPEDNRYWIPVYDLPDDRLTSELIVTVDSSLRVLSNGVLVGRQMHDDGTTTSHYVQNLPHTSYLISLAIGDFEVIEEPLTLADGRRIPLTYWVRPEHRPHVARTFGQTGEMIRFFSDRLGIPYPWDKYAQVVVRNFHFGGMENTSATTLTDRTIIDARAGIDYDPSRLIAHELAHQWFGNFVTAYHWSDIWLNEGFATYLSMLYSEHAHGDSSFKEHLRAARRAYLNETGRYVRPLVWDQWEYPLQMFDAHSYQKGAWVLHMLRRKIGEDAFFDGLHGYLEARALKPVETGDLRRALEEASDRDLRSFFQQWVYAAGHPIIRASYQYDAGAGALLLRLDQVQEGPSVPAAFDLSLNIEVETLGGRTNNEIQLRRRDETFKIPIEMAPRYVALDPEADVLIEVWMEQSVTAWVAQLRGASTEGARAEAAAALSAFSDDPALLIPFREALRQEESSLVRAAIVNTMASMPPSSAVERTLLETATHPDPVVQRAVLRALASYRGSSEAAAAALDAAELGVSYAIQAAAVETLVRIEAPGAAEIVRSALVTPSHGEVIRQAALGVLPLSGIPEEEALELGIQYSAEDRPAPVRAAAIRYLAHRLDVDAAANRLSQALDDPIMAVRQASIGALAEHGLVEAIPRLEERLSIEPQPGLREAIERAIRTITSRSEVQVNE